MVFIIYVMNKGQVYLLNRLSALRMFLLNWIVV